MQKFSNVGVFSSQYVLVCYVPPKGNFIVMTPAVKRLAHI